MALSLQDIDTLLRMRGRSQYGGEAVSQLDHALQCACLSEQAGETPHSVIAALLHDLGHLLATPTPGGAGADTEPDPHVDDLHQYRALPFLRGLLPAAVLEPIRLHVDAKRELCRSEPGYFDALSPASRRSLRLQGGVHSLEQSRVFMAQPFAAEALRLRRYDDLAKIPGKPTLPLEHFMALAARLAA